jgi:UDPglucose 6-dehydrogenase
MRVSVIGAGYVGLVTGACLADEGHAVIVCDVDPARVERIASGAAPIHEYGLDDVIRRNVGKRLRPTTDLPAAIADSDLTLIAVGTPSREGRIDLTAVVQATREIGAALARKNEYHAVVVKSTVVPGTTERLVRPLLEETSGKAAGEAIGVGMNPEFLTEGQAVADFVAPDRLVLGGLDERSIGALEELYAGFPSSVPRVRTNTTTAEMIKYASNGLLATMISYANEIGNLCSTIGDVDVVDVMHGVHLSRYLTPLDARGEPVGAPIASFLEAGCGFGGSCLPKDVRALIAEGAELGRPMRMLRAVIETNDAQPDEMLRLLRSELGDLRGRRISVLGLAFKPDTDDVRETPAVPLVRRLLQAEAIVTLHDPVVTQVPEALADADLSLVPDLAEAVDGADAIVLVTRWQDYEALPALLRRQRAAPLFVDGRRMLQRESVARYAGIGR